MLATYLLLAAAALDHREPLTHDALANVQALAAKTYGRDDERYVRFVGSLSALARDAGMTATQSEGRNDALRRLTEEAPAEEEAACPEPEPCNCPPSLPAPPQEPPTPPIAPVPNAPPEAPPPPDAPPPGTPPTPDPVPELIVTASVVGAIAIPSMIVVIAVCFCGK